MRRVASFIFALALLGGSAMASNEVPKATAHGVRVASAKSAHATATVAKAGAKGFVKAVKFVF